MVFDYNLSVHFCSYFTIIRWTWICLKMAHTSCEHRNISMKFDDTTWSHDFFFVQFISLWPSFSTCHFMPRDDNNMSFFCTPNSSIHTVVCLEFVNIIQVSICFSCFSSKNFELQKPFNYQNVQLFKDMVLIFFGVGIS